MTASLDGKDHLFTDFLVQIQFRWSNLKSEIYTHQQVFGLETHPFWQHIPNVTQYESAPPGLRTFLRMRPQVIPQL